MPVRVSVDGKATDEMVALGIRYAVDHGARIVSIGIVREDGGLPEPVLASAIDYAVSKGAFLVTPSGNNGNEVPTYPGAYPGVVATAGTDENDRLFDWSTPRLLGAARGSRLPCARRHHRLLGLALRHVLHRARRSRASPRSRCRSSRRSPPSRSSPGCARPRCRSPASAAGASTRTRRSSTWAPSPPPPPASKLHDVDAHRQDPARHPHPAAVGAGRLKLSFTVKPAESCSLTVVGGSELLLGSRRGRGTVGMDERVTAGRYTAQIACRTSKLKRYKLTLLSARGPARPCPCALRAA